MYIIEASLRGSAQWAPFYTNGNDPVIYAAASQKKLSTTMKGLRENSSYTVLNFRIKHYVPKGDEASVNE